MVEKRQRLARSEAQAKILRAAARVFLEKGKGSTIEDIAQEAEYSASALYKHFSGRDDIFRSLWQRVNSEILDVFTEPPPIDLPFIGHLKWILYRLAQFAEEERDLFIVALANTPLGEPPSRMDEELLQMLRASSRAFDELMQRGIDEGVLRSDGTAEEYSAMLRGFLSTINHEWALQDAFPLKPRINRAIELFLMGAGDPDSEFEGL